MGANVAISRVLQSDILARRDIHVWAPAFSCRKVCARRRVDSGLVKVVEFLPFANERALWIGGVAAEPSSQCGKRRQDDLVAVWSPQTAIQLSGRIRTPWEKAF